MKRLRTFSVHLAIFLSLPYLVSLAFAEDANIVGNGLGFASSNHALFLNPASLAPEQGSRGIGLEGLWLFNPASPIISIEGDTGSVGLAADYRKPGSNLFEGGLGFALGLAKFGVTLRTGNGSGFDADLAAMFDFDVIRLTLVARGLDNGPDQLAAGIGFVQGPVTFEVDVKKPFPLPNSLLLLDTGFGITAESFSASLGYDFSFVGSSFLAGGIHAGAGYALTHSFQLEAYYRPWAQEINSGLWTAGARYIF